MSKLRQQLDLDSDPTEAIATPDEGDLAPYVVFTKLTASGPHVYAGWLDAVDRTMAVAFAREHYGQDQKCASIWVIRREFLVGAYLGPTDLVMPGPITWQVFAQPKLGDAIVSLDGPVEAARAIEALAQARATLPTAAAAPELWVAPVERVVATADDDLIWRHTDQNYRLARGYSKTVRDKWEQVRERQAVREYEKEDLKESF